MFIGFGGSRTPWDKVDVAVEELLAAARMYITPLGYSRC
jgi:hypothetical protein